MTIIRTPRKLADGTFARGADGRIIEDVHITPLDGDTTCHVAITGAVTGKVVMADGTEYDVTPAEIQVHPRHTAAIDYAIARQHEASGHLETIIHGDGSQPCALSGDGCTGARVVVIGNESAFRYGHEGDPEDVTEGELVEAAPVAG